MVPFLPFSSLGSSGGQEIRRSFPSLAAAELLEGHDCTCWIIPEPDMTVG